MPNSTAKRRQRLFQQQGGRCHWCNAQCHLGASGKRMFTIDHLIHRMDPIRKTEGWQRQQGTVGACWKCNSRRGNEDMLRFSRMRMGLDPCVVQQKPESDSGR